MASHHCPYHFVVLFATCKCTCNNMMPCPRLYPDLVEDEWSETDVSLYPCILDVCQEIKHNPFTTFTITFDLSCKLLTFKIFRKFQKYWLDLSQIYIMLPS